MPKKAAESLDTAKERIIKEMAKLNAANKKSIQANLDAQDALKNLVEQQIRLATSKDELSAGMRMFVDVARW